MVCRLCCFCKIESIPFDLITLSARFADYFPWITQLKLQRNLIIKQLIIIINSLAIYISMICKIYTTTTGYFDQKFF